MKRPGKTLGMRHAALFVRDMAACEHFYVELLGMQVEWRPDEDNVYLTSGYDNLALHRAPNDTDKSGYQVLDHIGFFLGTIDEVDTWYEFLDSKKVKMKTRPRTHRDGARSFYCFDPEGITVQIIYHPPIVSEL